MGVLILCFLFFSFYCIFCVCISPNFICCWRTFMESATEKSFRHRPMYLNYYRVSLNFNLIYNSLILSLSLCSSIKMLKLNFKTISIPFYSINSHETIFLLDCKNFCVNFLIMIIRKIQKFAV